MKLELFIMSLHKTTHNVLKCQESFQNNIQTKKLKTVIA